MDDSPQTAQQPTSPPAADGVPAQRASWWRRTGVAAGLAVAALVLLAWQWYESHREISALREELTQKLAESGDQTRQSRLVMAETKDKLTLLESQLAASRKQQAALEALYQELARNRDEWVYAEIEQSLLVAGQQLQLFGNIKAALVTLQAADARLRRMDRPQLATLRKAINFDIERLQALPQVDTVAIGVRLDSLAGQLDKLPLAMDLRPQAQPAAKAVDGDAWTRFWRDTWEELKQLVRVQQIDSSNIALLAPSQAFFLRENLKLRLVGARLALLARDAASYRTDLSAARDWVSRYYDTRHAGVARALATLHGLQEAEVGLAAPEITATLEAVRKLRLARERAR